MRIVFETPRLLLGEFTENDAPLIFKLNQDPEVVKYLHEPKLETEEKAKKIITNIILPQYKTNLGRWAIYTKSNNEFIGWCGLKHIDDPDEIDLGYRLMKTAWGKGYATEAAQHTLHFGFTKLNLPVIVGKAHIKNLASINVLEKIGMKFLKEDIEDGSLIKIYTAANPKFSVKS